MLGKWRRKGGRTPKGEGLSCQEAMSVLYDYLDGELSADMAEKVRKHVEVCRKCYPHVDFERLFLDYLREKGGRPAHNEELERKVLTLLDTLE